MNRTLIMICCVVLVAVSSACAQGDKPKAPQDDALSKLIGDWSGESICVNKDKFPACKDEVVVYHITKVADKENTVHLSADKIVNGKPEFMGEFDFVFDAKRNTLIAEFKNERVHLSLEFTVKDDVIEGGIFSIPDRTQSRRISVKKDKESKPS